ncbi:CFEM domain-containing protein [Colletotrichum plurivorum]|uniref:CFEM domain-containing protein n=1 Tax=Colletotrichum plurivorum TaxID=2175906 RepID=A0A8H6JWB3_9PEZI|nr:CFEM domain-containing protein [Colletotrichum plurivorum]
MNSKKSSKAVPWGAAASKTHWPAATKNITWTACGYPNSNEYPKTIPARVTLFILLPTLSFVLRMVVKKAGLSAWGADDTTIVIGYILILGMTTSDYIWASLGAGKDLWTLPERNVTQTFQMLFACQIQYFITLTSIRASILFMYLRIFPGRTFRVVLWATHAFNASVWIAFLLVLVFRCIPVNLSWTFWNGGGGGSDHCLPIERLGTAQGVMFIALDVWLLILPATQVWRLNMKKSRKFCVTLMFGMGIFTTAIGIVRLKSISEATKYPLNPTVTSVMTGLWSCLECYVAVFTACAPNTWKFIKHFVLRKRETARDSGFQENRQEIVADGPKTPSQAPTETADEV